jgi:transporter family protein
MKDFQLWALASAFFAGLTAILAKKGVETVPSNLAVAVRVSVVLAFAVGIAVLTKQTAVGKIDGRAWSFLALSGIATGLSWLCYFRALELGPVAGVAPIDKLSFVIAVILGVLILQEKVTTNVWIGCGLIAAGVLVTLR